MDGFDCSDFDHVGIPTSDDKDGFVWLQDDGVWVTNPREHPLNVEWVRYAPGSRMHPRLQENLHLAYRVQDLDRTLEGRDVLVPPFEFGGGFAKIAFVDVAGIVVELMEYADPSERGWVT